MSQDGTQIPESAAKPLSVVIGGAGIGLLLAAAGFAFKRSQNSSATKSAGEGIKSAGIPRPSFKRKWALNAAIRMIENDASRKVLLNVLKAMAKRAK